MKPFSKKTNTRTLQTIVISGDRVSSVTLSNDSSGYKVIRAVTKPWPSTHAEQVGVVAAIATQKNNIVMVLPAIDYKFISMDLPRVSEADLKQAAHWRLQDMVDFDISEAMSDTILVPDSETNAGANQLVFTAIASNTVLEKYQTIAREAKLSILAIDIPEMAQRNINALLEPENRACALLYFDEFGGLLTVTYNKELHISRKIDITQQQIIGASAETKPQLFEKITLELQRSFDHIERQFRHLTLGKLCLASLEDNSLLEHLRRDLYVPVDTVSISELVDISACAGDMTGNKQQHYFHALGAAMRATGK